MDDIIKKIAVSGASGFIGSRLCEVLSAEGYEIWPMVRRKSSKVKAIYYDYQQGIIDKEKLKKVDAVIHLAGKNIMSGVWTPLVKKEIYDSRVKSTRLISHALAEIKEGPKILLNASAIGIYGDRADQKLDEESTAGHGYLAKLCVDWERGTLLAKKAGLRVVSMRISPVLDKEGGMLKAMLSLARLGLLATISKGDQYVSYVTREMIVQQMLFLLNNDIHGPVNMVAYEPVTQKELFDALAKRIHCPRFLSIPIWLLKLLGDQGEAFLASARVYPKVLIEGGFSFNNHQTIDQVLASLDV